jgi:heme-degrading monooxygenase HmoA
MEKLEKQIFIDKFMVPRTAIQDFKKRINLSMSIVSKQIGFVKNEAYENLDEEGNLNYLTIVIWENEEALKNSKPKVQKEYDKLGFNPYEMTEIHHIIRERSIYTEVKK